MIPRSVRWLTVASLTAVAGCKDDGGPPGGGSPASIVALSGTPQSAPAGTALAQPIRLQVKNAQGGAVGPGITVTFQIVGDPLQQGSLAGNSAVTGDDGTVTVPTWTLGKYAVPQVIRATVDNVNQDVTVSVATAYNVTVRFWGGPMSPAHQGLFTAAAARIGAFITGDVVDADARGGTISVQQQCGVEGQPNLNEIIDDILVYASIRSIDGPGNILASAFPCLGRPSPTGTQVAVGVMEFDSADLDLLTMGGSLQDVIIHEMLHTIGFGTLWDDRVLLNGKGGADPRYTGSLAGQSCSAIAAASTCTGGVPTENTGGQGTRDYHWRESVFGRELMTGFANAGAMPLSAMTINSMADIGLVVNLAAADQFSLNYRYMAMARALAEEQGHWERLGGLRGILQPDGRVTPVRTR